MGHWAESSLTPPIFTSATQAFCFQGIAEVTQILELPISEGLNVFKIKITTTLLWLKKEKERSNFVLQEKLEQVLPQFPQQSGDLHSLSTEPYKSGILLP